MLSEIGYITSFSPDLFQATGKQLLDSHRRVSPQRHLRVCAESGHGQPMPDLSRWPVTAYNLDNDAFLKTWLEQNADIIPDYLGGRATECDCPERHERHGKHKKACHYSWMNRNAARFFRKVAAWNQILQSDWPYRYAVWLDSDCIFKHPFPVIRMRNMLRGAAIGYFRGTREAPETGILLFDLEGGGAQFIKRVCDYFMSGAFRQEKRWDDGYIVGRMIDKGGGVYRDLVNKRKQRGNNVIPTTEIASFFTHEKGSHGTRLGVMK